MQGEKKKSALIQHQQLPEQGTTCSSILPESSCSGPSRTLQTPRATSCPQGHLSPPKPRSSIQHSEG